MTPDTAPTPERVAELLRFSEPGTTIASLCRDWQRLRAEVERLTELPTWIIRKLKTLGEYYEPPTDGRDDTHEIYGWMHVLCFHYVQNRRDVKEYDAARRQAKELAAQNAALSAEVERLTELNAATDRIQDNCNEWVAKALALSAALAEAKSLLRDVIAAWLSEANDGDGIREENGPILDAARAFLAAPAEEK